MAPMQFYLRSKTKKQPSKPAANKSKWNELLRTSLVNSNVVCLMQYKIVSFVNEKFLCFLFRKLHSTSVINQGLWYMNVFQGVRPPKCNENVRYFLSAYVWIIIQQSHCNCSLTFSCCKSSSLSTTARTLISRKAGICERMLRHRAVCWGHRAAFRILRTAWCKGCCTLWRTGKRIYVDQRRNSNVGFRALRA